MKCQVVQCPLAGAAVPLPLCLSCQFHRMGVDCPHYHRAFPEAYCKACLVSGVGVTENCPYAQVAAGLLPNPETPVLLAGFCGLPRVLKIGAFSDEPTAVLAAALNPPPAKA